MKAKVALILPQASKSCTHFLMQAKVAPHFLMQAKVASIPPHASKSYTPTSSYKQKFYPHLLMQAKVAPPLSHANRISTPP